MVLYMEAGGFFEFGSGDKEGRSKIKIVRLYQSIW